MADPKADENAAKNVVPAFMKPSTSADERRQSSSEPGGADAAGSVGRASTLSNAEKGHVGGHQPKRKTSTMAGVGKAFQVGMVIHRSLGSMRPSIGFHDRFSSWPAP